MKNTFFVMAASEWNQVQDTVAVHVPSVQRFDPHHSQAMGVITTYFISGETISDACFIRSGEIVSTACFISGELQRPHHSEAVGVSTARSISEELKDPHYSQAVGFRTACFISEELKDPHYSQAVGFSKACFTSGELQCPHDSQELGVSFVLFISGQLQNSCLVCHVSLQVDSHCRHCFFTSVCRFDSHCRHCLSRQSAGRFTKHELFVTPVCRLIHIAGIVCHASLQVDS